MVPLFYKKKKKKKKKKTSKYLKLMMYGLGFLMRRLNYHFYSYTCTPNSPNIAIPLLPEEDSIHTDLLNRKMPHPINAYLGVLLQVSAQFHLCIDCISCFAIVT